jgi:hypothetical protein
MNASPLLHAGLLASTLLVGGLLAACGSSADASGAAVLPPASSTTPSPGASSAPSSGNTPPLKSGANAEIVSTLRGAGFTLTTLPANLDDLHEPGHARMRAVMKTFTIALGTTCDGCHVKGLTAESSDEELRVDTPQKQVARKMWTRFVASLQRSDGSPIYCDTCHQGKMTFLDRTDKDALATWMQENFVDGLARKDGATQLCSTCHGQSANRTFLDTWRLP